jgi:ubiquinone/menaquinone biosynthesis C-methylase UbiE
MPLNAIQPPPSDPTSIFEHFRAGFGSALLIAAQAHFRVFERLAARPMTLTELRQALSLEERAAIVLITPLRAMGLVVADGEGRLSLSKQALEQLTQESYFSIADYIGLASDAPQVLELVARLQSNSPANSVDKDAGAAFIYKEGMDSAMEKESSARQLTLALAGRARNVAPVLAEKVLLESGVLLDVGGGTGIYSIALLQKNPNLRAVILDRPEVIRIAKEFAESYAVSDRMTFLEGDMFTAPFPSSDFILLSNILHDWDVGDCETLIRKCAGSLRPGGRLLIHDVLLNDALDGPLAVACYSAQLFTLTEGRAYSAAEYRAWLRAAGLASGEFVPTLAHCHVVSATKG